MEVNAGCISDGMCGQIKERTVMCAFFFFQAEDGIRDLVRSRGLGDVYKRQPSRRYANIVFEHKNASHE